ncbi:MAG: EamA family transporter [Flavobacteriaceae bacterium]
MIDLGLSILFSSLIFVIFKLFTVYKVQTFYAIIVNYVVACLVGIFAFDTGYSFNEILAKPWFFGALSLGILFIIVFNLMARTSQKLGVSVASVATKMSLVIPVLVGVFLYSETLGLIKILGILLALCAVYFASVREKGLVVNREVLLLPLLVFVGSGLVDVSIKYFEETLVTEAEFPIFTSCVFAGAALTGTVIILIRLFQTPFKIAYRNVVGGILLGVPNFFSIFFILRALQHETLNSASVFTINNVAIVMCTTLLGIMLFKEHISSKNWLGIAMAVISIVMVALGDHFATLLGAV